MASLKRDCSTRRTYENPKILFEQNLEITKILFEQSIKALLDRQLTTLQRKVPLQTQKLVAVGRLLHFHHQTRLNHLNRH